MNFTQDLVQQFLEASLAWSSSLC